jgi:hypothetical protein
MKTVVVKRCQVDGLHPQHAAEPILPPELVPRLWRQRPAPAVGTSQRLLLGKVCYGFPRRREAKSTIISHSGNASKTIKLIGIGVYLIGYSVILLYQLTIARGIGENSKAILSPGCIKRSPRTFRQDDTYENFK